MADYFAQEDEQTTPDESQEQEENTFTVGDDTYTQEELQALVEKGRFAQEVEEKQNTKLDRVFPEYTKTSQELKKAKEELEQLRAQAEQSQTQQTGDMDESQIKQAQEAARKIGLVTMQDFEDLMSKSFSKYYASEKSVDQRMQEGRELEKQIDGSDGRPKFDMQDMAEWMSENNYGNLSFEDAYTLRYKQNLNKWQEDQIQSSKRGGMETMTGSTAGSKQPANVKVTRDNLESLIDESLSGNY